MPDSITLSITRRSKMVPFGAVRCTGCFEFNTLNSSALPLDSIRCKVVQKGQYVVYTELVGGSIPSLPTILILRGLQFLRLICSLVSNVEADIVFAYGRRTA